MYSSTLIFSIVSLFSFYPSSIDARAWAPRDGCPTTIHTLISGDPCERYGYGCSKGPEYNNMGTLHKALLHCPNITSIDLRITGLGCSNWPLRWNFPFHPAGGETYPPLRFLRLEGYRWDRPQSEDFQPAGRKFMSQFGVAEWAAESMYWVFRGDAKTWLQWRILPAEQRNKNNLQLWLDAMDWSHIEHLWIKSYNHPPEIVEKLPPRLKALKSLETESLPFIEALPNNTLTNLTWIGSSEYQDLPTILAHQGQSLQRLEFRCDELECSEFLPQFNMSILSSTAMPHLTQLSINVPRNGTWPLESFKAIASIQSLRKANLWFNIQSLCRRQMPDGWQQQEELERQDGKNYCQGEESFQKPFVNGSSALEMFEYMKAQNEGGELEEVTFWVGDWTRPWNGPLYFPPWAERRRSKVICKASESEQTNSTCVVEYGEEYWKQETRW